MASTFLEEHRAAQALVFRGPQPAHAWEVYRDRIAPIADGFMYRVETRRNIERIAREGVRPDPGSVTAGFTGQVTTWWGSDLRWVLLYFTRGTIVLRTARESGEFVRSPAVAPEYWCDAGVPAEQLEYLGEDRQWYALRLRDSGGET